MTVSARLAFVTVALGATLAGHAQVPAPLPIPKGTNVLLGRVVEIGADTPIASAIVTLFGYFDAAGKPLTGIPQGLTADASAGRSIMTTADGYFVFRDLPAGRYAVAVRAMGYAGISYSHVIEVNDNEKPSPIPLRLWRYAAIGGRVVDERGEPVVGMHVNALRRSISAGRVVMNRASAGAGAAVAVTDDRGIYRIAQLTPGEYVVGVLSTTTTMPVSFAGAMEASAANREAYLEASGDLRRSGIFRTWGCTDCWESSSDGQRYGNLVLQRLGPAMPPAPGGKPLGFANAFYPGTSNLSDATAITLASGESRAGVDIPIRFADTVSISGVVTGPDGPVRHQIVRLVPPGVSLNDVDPSGIAIAVTDAQGSFTILGVTPGEYSLSTAFGEFNDATGDGRTLATMQQLAVGDTNITGITLALQTGARVTGRMEFRSANRPAGRMGVSLFPTQPLFARTFSAYLQPDGTFQSVPHPPGQYTISASVPTGWHWQSTTLGGKPLADEILELGASDLTGLVLTLGQTTNALSGTVTDANGAPDAGALVIAFVADSSAAWREGIFTTRRFRVVNASSKGAYQITTLAPGEYYIAAVNSRSPLNVRDPQFLERLIAGAMKISLGVEDSKTLALKSVAITGR